MTKRKTDAQRLTDQINEAWSNIRARAERDGWRIAADVAPAGSAHAPVPPVAETPDTDSRP